MEIKIEIGTRGDRLKFRKTYTREFLEDKGLMQLNNDSFGPYSPWRFIQNVAGCVLLATMMC